MIKTFIENIQRPVYWIPKMMLIVLGNIHEYTKYHTARSFSELFYWPEGLCWDMLVLALFGVAGIWSMWEDLRFVTTCEEIDIYDD